MDQTDPEDILSSSLETLYDYAPITQSSAGSVFTYTRPLTPSSCLDPASQVLTINLITPDTQAKNWSLHASSIWVSSLFLADHLEDLHLDRRSSSACPLQVLELGAGAGLPSILISRLNSHVFVTASDYPDADLIRALEDNVKRNNAADRCRVVPFAWGSDIIKLIPEPQAQFCIGDEFVHLPGFDAIVAADTLWNPELHQLFIDTLCRAMTKTADARAYLVAGLHTGRYTIQAFLNAVLKVGLEVEEALERELKGDGKRGWMVERAEEEDERERRRWVVWIVLKWGHEAF
ncbi:hypothetical protein EW146_g5421 [Bondarzewia mesenterica]|uniref:Uncharacterized protein n=1 Tax=Bondarzewia mesenterica TaxID=1095465 RepID=A0A4S4LRI7_9AGAM|nr:hypothetical protein EW146_g5421 [Bondarzewia mesenterica]